MMIAESICTGCSTAIPIGRKYCSRSCSARVNNSLSPKRGPVIKINCMNCGAPPSKQTTKNTKFCSKSCEIEYKSKNKSDQHSSSINKNNIKLTYSMKKYIKNVHYKSTCCSCGLSEWLGQKISLEIDHIDGDANNNFINNLRVLCPNCHSQTPTYKGKNRGKGRAWRSMYYKKNNEDQT